MEQRILGSILLIIGAFIAGAIVASLAPGKIHPAALIMLVPGVVGLILILKAR